MPANVILKPRRALPFFSQHPWVFQGAIAKVEGEPEPGDEVLLLSHEGQFIARGLYNPNSNIRVRLYAWDKKTDLDREFWSSRLDEAIQLRRNLFANWSDRSACRLVFSEADGISGMTVDRYGDWLVVQLTSLALSKQQDVLFELLQSKLKPKGIWLRTERGIREAEGLEAADGLIVGEEPSRPLFIEENTVQYGVDLVTGQKTGFYLDQSANRTAVAGYVKNHRVLDMFCYTGAFGITAACLGGAKQVVGIDSSESSLEIARANAQLNGVSQLMTFEKSDAFAALEQYQQSNEQFDTVILDPPKMARHRAGLNKALRGYLSLNQLAMEVVKPGGLLVSCSCSGLVDRETFENMLAKAAVLAKRSLQFLEIRGQAADHPISSACLENAYLKCYICRVV